MCTHLFAVCACNHYQPVRVLRPCATPSPSCHDEQHNTPPAATVRFQRVTFQCSSCDMLDQELLELRIAAETRVREAAREIESAGAWTKRRSWMSPLSGGEAQALGAMMSAEMREREREILAALESEVARVKEEWGRVLEGRRVRLEEVRD